jgi:uncharacterized protein with PQ loop repeat
LNGIFDYAPAAATAFAIPQFLPQITKLRRTNDNAGISWSWATLTSINNVAWAVYFALSRFWTALVPAFSVTVLAGVLAVMLYRRARPAARLPLLITGWSMLLCLAFAATGRAGLGATLTAGFVVQVTPPIWTAYRTVHPTGLSRGTWLLILGELASWAGYGVQKSDPRLITLGFTGVGASVLMLARIRGANSAPTADTSAG